MNDPLLLEFNGSKIKFIGDPHLGRNFSIGQLPSRAGEREEIQWDSFRKALTNPEGARLCVIVGDLFDQFQVRLDYVFRACKEIEVAAARFPDGIRVISGNHDLSKEVGRYSSFHIAAAWFRQSLDVKFFYETTIIEDFSDFKIGYCPWHPTNSAKTLAFHLFERGQHDGIDSLDVVVGHWDVESFGGSDFNLVPTAELAHFTSTIVTGHIHQPQTIEEEDVTIHVTGSLEPFTHGEDPDGKLYVTLTVEQYEEDPTKYKDKCLRFLLDSGETLPQGLNCLAVTTKKVSATEDKIEVKLDDSFNLEKIFKQCMAEKAVSENLTASLWAKCQELVSKNA